MGEKWLYNAPIVVFPPSHFSGGKLTMGGKWLYNTGVVYHIRASALTSQLIAVRHLGIE